MTTIYRSAAGEQAVTARYRQFLDLWPAPYEHLRIPTSQGETFVIASGPKDAPAMILLHGSSSNSSMWMGDVAKWSETRRVYAIDMIGEPGLSAHSRPHLASGAYGPWIDEVVRGLGLARTSVVGMSLGGWLALDYATLFPQSVDRLVLLCPAGIGRHKNVLLWVVPLLLCGAWGRRKIGERIGGKQPSDPSPAWRAFAGFSELISSNFLPRLERIPTLDDTRLRRLTMPILAILAGRDVFIDSIGVQGRLNALTPQAQITFLPQARHLLLGFTDPILAFLDQPATPEETAARPHLT